jgi:hypothetical protein
MQKIQFTGEEKYVKPRVDVAEGEIEYITDPDEIRGVIRRAATMIWEDHIFTLNELQQHLQKNDVVLPVPEEEHIEWLEMTLGEIWYQQKELARTALKTMPTFIREKYEGEMHYGIVVPNQPVVRVAEEIPSTVEVSVPTPDTVEPVLEVTTETAGSIEDVVSIAKTPDRLVLTPKEIGVVIFDQFVSFEPGPSKISLQRIISVFKSLDTDTPLGNVKRGLEIMVENGYLQEPFKTGKGKQKQTWYVMDADVKADVIDDKQSGTFEDCLDSLFRVSEEVA